MFVRYIATDVLCLLGRLIDFFTLIVTQWTWSVSNIIQLTLTFQREKISSAFYFPTPKQFFPGCDRSLQCLDCYQMTSPFVYGNLEEVFSVEELQQDSVCQCRQLWKIFEKWRSFQCGGGRKSPRVGKRINKTINKLQIEMDKLRKEIEEHTKHM